MSIEINKILMDIHRSVGSMETTLAESLKRLDEHEDKIDSLEKLKTQALTLVGVVTFAMTFGWDWIKHKLGI